MDERFAVPDFDLEDDEVPTTICSRYKEEYDIAEIECPSCGLTRRVPCTCTFDDGIHEWDCAIEVEKRNNLEANKMLDRMAPFFGLEKKQEAHGFRWAEKSASTKSRLTKRAADAASCAHDFRPIKNNSEVCVKCRQIQPRQ